MMDVTDMQKIGIGLAGFGVTFVMLGMVLFFDKGLLAIGNLLFIVGLSLLIGIERTFRFFLSMAQSSRFDAVFRRYSGCVIRMADNRDGDRTVGICDAVWRLYSGGCEFHATYASHRNAVDNARY